MKKRIKPVKIILIMSVLAFVILLGMYFYQKKSSKPPVVSKREQFQQEYDKR